MACALATCRWAHPRTATCPPARKPLFLQLLTPRNRHAQVLLWALCVPGDNSGVVIGVIRGGRMPVPKMCRVLYQFYFVARVRRLYVLHHDA